MSGLIASDDGLFDLIETIPALQNRFTNLKRLNRGGFSLVFTAKDSESGSQVVVKFLHPFEREQYRIESFKRESEILEQLRGRERIIALISPRDEFTLSHPPIRIPLSYYVVEKAKSDVEHVIESGGLGTEETLLLFREMCKALRCIHLRGLVHRDIKPGNFLLMENGDLKLSDFGTARLIEVGINPILTDYAGFPPGDVRYMAPEMIASLHDTDAGFAFSADVFSLGAILFELFTGTILVSELFDPGFQDDLLKNMAAIPRDKRRLVFDGIIESLADSRSLPSVTSFAPKGRRCVFPIINDLYRSMAALDYHKRTATFEYIFLKIEQALCVLRNEEKLNRWREKRSVYRQNLLLKRERIITQWATSRAGEGK
jgi:serine/threonine protein kinase